MKGAALGWQTGLHWLQTHEENWFLIMDHVDNPKIHLRDYLPSCDHGNVLITSMNAGLQDAIEHSLEIQDMNPDEGTELFLKHAIKGSKSQAQKEQAAKIAQELYYFPLALVHAGAYTRQQNCLFTYLGRLESQRKQLLSNDFNQSMDRYRKSVYATWNLS
ncbi:hypothetical protein J3R30DRAFT_3313544 [Lentinula aciculospora]|uniref:Uncharacterized protein n=1 Tax=Lentinula aciculospora TaxID=153920 RepID=A0A9W9DF07_9AGAR|nr:hypothetical protein J3R30DRAFT_3313544 [Lentinula aciculospora]